MDFGNTLVLDLETQKAFKEVGKDQLDKLKVSLVGVYDYRTQSYVVYEEKDIMRLNQRLQEVDLLVGFNIRRFDLRVLEPYLFRSVESFPVLDLMEGVEKVRGHRASLESLTQPTLNSRKAGSGADAVILYKEQRMEELKQYCLQDVRLTKEIFEYGCQYGKVFFTSSWDYRTYEIPVDWKDSITLNSSEDVDPKQNFPSSLF